jgi:hypothetical protein
MKKVIYSLLGIALISGVVYSCKKEKIQEEIVGETYHKEELFNHILENNSELNKQSSIQISFEFDKSTDMIRVINSNQITNNYQINEMINQVEKDKRNKALDAATKYTVSCDFKYSKDWSKSANSKEGAWALLKSCLDKGGTGNVCQSSMIYIPAIETFVINVDDFNNVNSKVDQISNNIF